MTSILHTFPIERYRLKGFLGQGAQGTVSLYEKVPWYFILGYLLSYGKPKEVAVKIFQPNESYKLAAELEHIVKVRVWGTVTVGYNDTVFIPTRVSVSL